MADRPLSTVGDWDDMRARFQWRVPDDFNIAAACCDVWANAEPDRLALIEQRGDGIRNWTFWQLRDASDRFANVLAADGIGQGDRVAILLPQAPEVLITHFAAMKLGAVTVPLFSLFGPDALQIRLSDSGAKAIITNAEGAAKLTGLDLPGLSRIYVTDQPISSARDFWGTLNNAPATPRPPAARATDPAMIIYTSGTTGPPKGALHAHRFLLVHLPTLQLCYEDFPKPGDIGWTPADWAWIGGLMDLALPCLYFGVPVVCHRMAKFDARAAWDLIARHRVSVLFLPPTALNLLREVPITDCHAVRAIGSGGEALSPALHAWARNQIGAPINEFYGQTECNLVITGCSAVLPPRDGAIGRAAPGHDVAVIDAAGQSVAQGEIGQIAVRATKDAPDPVMFLRYWNAPKATATKFIGDWMVTGDLGRMDADGYISFVARDDDVITSSGYRIGPAEIESCLTSHPDVTLAAAIGIPDPVRTEVVVAHVVLRDGAEWAGLERDLIDLVRDRISPHVAPRRIIRADALPMTATGKIMRRALREEYR